MKFMSWLGKMILIVIMVSSLTLFTTGLVVNAYIKSMLASFNIELEGQPFAWAGVLQGVMGKKPTPEIDKLDSTVVNQGDNESTADTSTISKDSNSADTKGNSGSSSGPEDVGESVEEEAPVGALPVMGESYEEAAGVGQQDQQVIITPDEVVRKKDDLPASEKEEIFNILMTKVPQDKIQEITVAMENGFTEQELKQVEETMSKYLSKEEYTKLMDLLK